METKSSDNGVQSVRKTYLNKRAEQIRENLNLSDVVFERVIQDIQSQSFNATRDELLFAECLQWMKSQLHLEGHITLLAKNFDVSVRKIQRLFSFFTKKTYTTFLLEMRIEESKKYLAEHKRSIGEVAYLVGIKDHAYFTYLFRKHTGMTPSQYRLTLMKI